MRAPGSIGLLLALLLALGCGSGEEAPIPAGETAGLNVILLTFDALRADGLGVYGSNLGASPRIDAWAERAIVFENAYATTPVTPTSVASILSGRPPHEVYRDWRFDGAGSLAPTFAAAGYATGAFVHNPHLVPQRGYAKGFRSFVVEKAFESRFDGRLLTRALGWMTQQSGPFLAWVHLLDPHSPWNRTELAERLYDPKYRGRYLEGSAGATLVEDDPTDLARLKSLYAGEVLIADRRFALMFEALSAAGLLERSVIVLTADHGEALMEHGLLQHAQVYEEDLRIPLIVGVPGLEEGRRIEARVTQLDVFPTLASLAGVDVPRAVAGRDLTRPLPADAGVVGVAYSSARYQQASFATEEGLKVIVECGESPTGDPRRRRLFDLRRDPDEQQDLGAERGAEAEALERRLWQALGLSGCEQLTMVREGGRSERDGLDPETVQRLKALGYMTDEP